MLRNTFLVLMLALAPLALTGAARADPSPLDCDLSQGVPKCSIVPIIEVEPVDPCSDECLPSGGGEPGPCECEPCDFGVSRLCFDGVLSLIDEKQREVIATVNDLTS